MFPTFIGILDIQSWWEVPSIAHFCSLFRDAFNLLDFDIEDLEEALLTDSGTEGHLLQELIVRLLEGCLPEDTRNDISTFNYQMFLRRLFRKKCQECNRENPFNTDTDFELLPLRQKVEILRALCDFRLDANDVEESLGNLDSDSLRVEPLGHDHKNSAYWYFYGTRLYREDFVDTSDTVSQKQKSRSRDKRHKRRRGRLAKEEEEEEEKEENCPVYTNRNKGRESIWQVVCFTLQDWSRLVEKFKDSEFATERKLYKTLSKDFMPEIPKLFDLKEKQQRRKILQRSGPRTVQNIDSEGTDKPTMVKSKVKTKSNKIIKKSSSQTLKNIKAKDEIIPLPVTKKGRQTNNSLASVDGQILIDTCDDLTDLENKKGSVKHGGSVSSGYGYGYEIGIEEEEQQVGMHKILKILKDHEDSWPFTDPVDEQYAPRYYSVVRKPMDLTKMEEKLDEGAYKTINQFKRDFRLIIDNCRQYNGSDNEYTEMAMNLKDIFDKAVERYLEFEHSSDDSLSTCSGASVGSPNYKNKSSSPSVVRHSQRHKHSRKLSKKDKLNNKIHKKHEKEESEPEVKVTKEKKKDKKKSKKCKSEMKVEEKNKEEENDGAISDENVIKSKKKKSSDTDKTVSKSKKVSVKEEIDEQQIKSSKKQKKESKHEKGIHVAKEKESRKRKEDFEEDYEISSISKSKSRKIEKNESKEVDVLINRVKKNKKEVKKESPDTSLEEEEKLSSINAKNKKNSRKLNKEKSEPASKHDKKDKNKKSKRNSDELIKNGELKKDSDMENIENKANVSKSAAKIIESIVTNKDIESLDSLKDRISERRREEKLKIEQEKKKKQSSKGDAFHGTSKKVPSNGSTYHDIDKLGGKKIKSKKVSKEDKSIENKSQNQDESEPKKIKTFPSKHPKGSSKAESAIQALHQATERTLNDINKWLDDAPRLSEFSSGSDSPVLQASTSDSSRATTLNKQLSISGGDTSSRKRPSSIKLIGPIAPVRPKKVQRTIDRLQPGKSKGNLLSKKPPSNESAPSADPAVNNKDKDNEKDKNNKEINDEPKLSLGTVLKNADSIQLICKSIVSSPNPNGSNDEDDECGSKPATPAGIVTEEEKTAVTKKPLTIAGKDEKEKRIESEEVTKPKSATPNLSAWFKAFGAPKSKKKEEEEEAVPKKEETLDTSIIGISTRQRRISTGGSSVSESLSSYSQESPPSRTGRSPQQQQQQLQSSSSILSSPAAMEPQLRGAGFYQDALSTGSSPYNSPYYTTPPRYSAQLPPTPSPQHHPLSPAYPSTQPTPPRLYSQISPSHQSFQKPSPQAQSPGSFSQQSPQNESYNSPSIPPTQNQSPIYPQQPSPQQPPTPNYSQPSPQTPANYSQASPQQQHSPYSQSSPQPPPSYSQPSPQSQHSPYSQSSPQQSNFSQVSPRPPSSTYSQPSPQPPGYTAQTPSPYSQPDLVIAQPSPRGYSQTSPQTPSPYSAQASPQQQPPSYSQASPQTPPSYSQPSPQQPRTYSQPSPQQSTTQQQQSQQQAPVATPQIANYSQPTAQIQVQAAQIQTQTTQIQAQAPAADFVKAPENYSQNISTSPFSHPVKSPYSGSTAIAKPTATKDKHVQQQSTDPLTALNQQVYQSASTTQYAANYPSGVYPGADRVPGQLGSDPTARSSTSRLTNHEAQQQLAQQRQVQQTQEQQSQLLSFQQNLASHESLYSSSFQTTPYPMPNPACRPVYPGYFDASAKSTSGIPSPSNSLAPVKKRTYNEPSTVSEAQATQRASQDQFGFDQLMALAHSQSDVSNQFDNAFSSSLADSNPAYTRLQLGLVSRTAKETQQLLSIPRPPSKNDPLTAYARTATPSQSELDLNLLQSFAVKNSSMLSMQRRGPEQSPVAQSTLSTTKSKKSKKSKQQQQQQQAQLSVATDQQTTSIPGFPQYGATGTDPMSLKQPSSAFNFAGSASATNSSPFYDAKDAAAYAFLDEFRNHNSSIYYSMALQQQQQQAQQQAQQQVQQQSTPVSDAAVQAANKQTAAAVAAARNYSFLHSATQRASPYAPAVPSYVSPHGPNLGVDPAAYQRYMQYYMHPPPHPRPAWL
ncbi:protein split ends-like isoform X2 [Phymastichus coffea]|uniref:protein split ends-like isoform X2 n=1 Tax=Phymastichus coffea TaxID=108790 RepID=UPI00273BF736|nr:protein split ends-like isoform X2 [Phymastichus coffea]